ncbi:MAG: CDP-glycerol glycerophosphotransferase family protein [Clostridia bacterium]|nr:CDP-glycerol glycerophosphotransferase family protein [Clostridia bacterium]MBQ8893209.1 CDP-glycerol glycerophosphotransferase family protein [Clostridia bacterium]
MGIVNKLYIAGCWVLSLALPVNKKKVVFSSYYGRGYSDNPKAICEALRAADSDAELVWLVKNEKEAASLPEGVKPCPYGSARRVFALATAGVWVDNCRKYDRFKKKNQYYLQTWHGFPLKRIEKDAYDALGPEYEKGAKRDSAKIDLLLSNSGFCTETLRRCFWYDGEIAEYGSPRNDVFFKPDPHTDRKVREAFSLPADRKLVLYAPTFRADHSMDAYELDAKKLGEACEKRFGGKWTVLIRLHPNVAFQSEKLFAYDGETVVDATMYPDMQELLCGCDMLITDYSSSMFDFALSGKPCLRFALDIEDYKKDRNFYFTQEEMPFPLADSNEALAECVLQFNEASYQAVWKAFTEKNTFCEDGNAAKRCADWILEKIK